MVVEWVHNRSAVWGRPHAHVPGCAPLPLPGPSGLLGVPRLRGAPRRIRRPLCRAPRPLPCTRAAPAWRARRARAASLSRAPFPAPSPEPSPEVHS